MKKGIRFLALIVCLLMIFSSVFGVFADESSEVTESESSSEGETESEGEEEEVVPDVPPIDKAISAGIDYYKTVQKERYETDSSILGTPFHVMLRAQTNMIQQFDYHFMVPIYNASNVGMFIRSEEFAKAIIVSTLTGQNPRTAVQGIDMVERLVSLQQSDGRFMFTNAEGGLEFSIEGHIWSIIALDMINVDYNRIKAISALFSYTLPDGGVQAPEGTAPSLDLTALTVLAISKYTNPDVVAFKNKAVGFIRSSYKDGVFTPVDEAEPNVITQGYAIMALIAAGESVWNEPYTTADFSPMDYLIACQDESGGFWYSKEAFLSGGSGDHKAAEDYASAVALCALLDIKNTRSHILNVGEKFVDTTHTEKETEPTVTVFESKYVWSAAAIVLAALIFVFLFGMFFSDPKKKHKIKKLKKTLQK